MVNAFTQIPITRSAPSSSLSRTWKERLHSYSLEQPLDRVNVLGDDTHGHTGCVNALSWAKDGELLMSGGDDRTVRLWRIDPSDTTKDYPFVCEAVIFTGHTANIFNAQMLPNSNRIVTVAGDKQVRISDVGAAFLSSQHRGETEYSSRQANVRVLHCHSARVKRIVTEESPDLFLTVSEDGTVRQHDLRVPHQCRLGTCPAPLVRVDHELSTMALSPLAPYQLVVAGESPYGYLFDRRHAGRSFREEWGMLPEMDDVTTCVRRLGRASHGLGERRGSEHITGARMASTNSHEVLLSYSSDAVYLYSTHDEPQTPEISGESSVLPPNNKSSREGSAAPLANNDAGERGVGPMSEVDIQIQEDLERYYAEAALMDDEDEAHSDDRDASDEEEEERQEEEQLQATASSYKTPVIYPRARFAGACNVETVKDVNFLGPHDEFVVSGSDDGYFFMWKKSTRQLHDIIEGDGSVVNVIEGHPHLPLIAVSGIDTTVKLFGPGRGHSFFSRLSDADAIIRRNSEAASRRVDLASLFLRYQISRRAAVGGSNTGCTFQ